MSKSTHKNNASHALSGCYGICQAFVNINERLEQKPDIYRCTGSISDRRGFYAVIQINLGTVLLRGLQAKLQAQHHGFEYRQPIPNTGPHRKL